MANDNLIWVMTAHLAWTVFLYAALTLVRAPRVWSWRVSDEWFSALEALEPKLSANLSNQFEWPLFFYLSCLVTLAVPLNVSHAFLWCAWGFILGRVLHTGVQVLTGSIRARGIVFIVNFLAVIFMWGLMLEALLV